MLSYFHITKLWTNIKMALVPPTLLFLFMLNGLLYQIAIFVLDFFAYTSHH